VLLHPGGFITGTPQRFLAPRVEQLVGLLHHPKENSAWINFHAVVWLLQFLRLSLNIGVKVFKSQWIQFFNKARHFPPPSYQNWVAYMVEIFCQGHSTNLVMSSGVIITPQASGSRCYESEPSKLWISLVRVFGFQAIHLLKIASNSLNLTSSSLLNLGFLAFFSSTPIIFFQLGHIGNQLANKRSASPKGRSKGTCKYPEVMSFAGHRWLMPWLAYLLITIIHYTTSVPSMHQKINIDLSGMDNESGFRETPSTKLKRT